MRNKTTTRARRVLLPVLLALLLLTEGCIGFVKKPAGEDPVPVIGTFEKSYLDAEYPPYRTDVTAVMNDLLTGRDGKYLALVNKAFPVTDHYDPKSGSYLLEPLVKLDRYVKKDLELEGRTARALYAMLDEMAADGVSDVYVTSAYRSQTYQKTLFNNYVSDEENRISRDAIAFFGEDYIQATYYSRNVLSLTREDAEKVANFYSAYPGQSEHHTGLCVDFTAAEVNGQLDRDFELTSAFAWLAENAYRFGFILRYPENRENITGYCYEPWHFRFVGREAATDIFLNSLTLEEYLGKSE